MGCGKVGMENYCLKVQCLVWTDGNVLELVVMVTQCCECT